MSGPGPRRGRPVRVLVALALTAGVVIAGAYALHRLYAGSDTAATPEVCTVGDYELSPDQAAVAATMVGAVTRYRPVLPHRATVLVLAAALQESKLTNLAPGDGDRDSVGVLQQRPSQGWGSVAGQDDSIAARTARLTDVGEATREFLAALVKVARWRTMPLADAIQTVQISADGTLYAQHEPEATALAAALQGLKAAAISCSFAAPTAVAPATTVAAQARKQLGITTPAATSTGVRVPGAGWQTAAWFVANGDRLGIEQVGYAGRRWTRTSGWKTDATMSRAAVTAVLAKTT